MIRAFHFLVSITVLLLWGLSLSHTTIAAGLLWSHLKLFCVVVEDSSPRVVWSFAGPRQRCSRLVGTAGRSVHSGVACADNIHNAEGPLDAENMGPSQNCLPTFGRLPCTVQAEDCACR